MKIYLWIVFCLAIFCCHAQKDTSFRLEAEGVENLVLIGHEIFKINLRSAKGSDISYTTHSEGEYFNLIHLKAEVKGNTLFLISSFPEVLSSGYDKLSAHKVFSLEVKLEVPEGLFIDIQSNRASVYANGKYEKLVVQLKTGSCFLNDFQGEALVNTYIGNIEVVTEGVKVSADSRHGIIMVMPGIQGKSKLELNSIYGDIQVRKP